MALACGIPVVAFNIGGNADLVQNGRNGFLIPLLDLEGRVARAYDLLSGPRPGKFAARARRDFRDRFSAERIGEEYASAFEALNAT